MKAGGGEERGYTRGGETIHGQQKMRKYGLKVQTERNSKGERRGIQKKREGEERGQEGGERRTVN